MLENTISPGNLATTDRRKMAVSVFAMELLKRPKKPSRSPRTHHRNFVSAVFTARSSHNSVPCERAASGRVAQHKGIYAFSAFNALLESDTQPKMPPCALIIS